MRTDLLFQVLESQPTTASAFDYLKDPLYRNDLKSLLRMYDILPLMGKLILQEIEDRLSNAGLIIQSLKKDLPKIGLIADTEMGMGKVVDVNILKGTYKVDLDEKGIVEFDK